MRTGLMLCVALAAATIGTTAFAKGGNDNADDHRSRGTSIKEQVLEKQKEGFGKSTQKASHERTVSKAAKPSVMKPKGEVYGDQATRSKGGSRSSGKNLSNTGSTNNPSEIKAVLKMINPMMGAYRTCEAAEGTDSYGGRTMTAAGYASHSAANGGSKYITQHVYMKNDKGEVQNSTHGNGAVAMKNRQIKNMVMGLIMAKAKEKAGLAGK